MKGPNPATLFLQTVDVVEAEAKLDIPVEDFDSSRQFNFRVNVATVLGIALARIEITSIRSGSTIVNFLIKEDPPTPVMTEESASATTTTTSTTPTIANATLNATNITTTAAPSIGASFDELITIADKLNTPYFKSALENATGVPVLELAATPPTPPAKKPSTYICELDPATGEMVCRCERWYYGESCDRYCPCYVDGTQSCNDGISGDGTCTCKDHWVG
jgi:hypothetical protein